MAESPGGKEGKDFEKRKKGFGCIENAPPKRAFEART
jgi:hypothetical protein